MIRFPHLRTRLSLYGILLLIFSIFSFALTDPNLVLTSWPPYWQFQQWIWHTFFLDANKLTVVYTVLISLLWISFAGLIQAAQRSRITLSNKTLLGVVGVLSTVLLFSYNALSHDIFNYIFNAKIVLFYQANPHIKTALDFAQDPWVRFMHNTHTPAPYGYGWTLLSLLPFGAGLGKFTLTWLWFKIASWLSLLATGWGLGWLYRMRFGKQIPLSRLAIGVLTPLALLEVVSSGHNDLWMMFPALLAIGWSTQQPLSIKTRLSSLLLLGLSITIKLATVGLLPLWLLGNVQSSLSKKHQSWFNRYWPLLASCLMFIPLLSSRSQFFHPWYLLWALVWLPLLGEPSSTAVKNQQLPALSKLEQLWQTTLLTTALGSTFRYIPWLSAGAFYPGVLAQQQLITFGAFFLGLAIGSGLLIWGNIQKKPRVNGPGVSR